MEVFRSIFGSRLYGTATPESDTDYKYVFLPSARDLVLQRAPKNTQKNTKKEPGEKNTAADVDCEGFSLQEWLSMVAHGQTMATELLFTPEAFLVGEPHPAWHEIQAERHRLISKKVAPFVGYCRSQASKYCVKAERVRAARMCVETFRDICTHADSMHGKIIDHLSVLIQLASDNEYIDLQMGFPSPNDNWFSCCGRKMPLTASPWRAWKLYTEILDGYGHRVTTAANGDGIDWKSMYHALRVATEATELLTTGIITLPRPEAGLLLQIRQGKLSYGKVSELIEEEVAKVEKAQLTSSLPEAPDYQWVEDFVLFWHIKRIQPWFV